MTPIRILASALALVGAGMVGGIAGPMIAGADTKYTWSNKYQPAYEPIRAVDRLHLTAGEPVTIHVEVPHATWDAPAAAVAVNLTVVAPEADGYLTAWPAGYPQPATSNVNYQAGEDESNFAIVPVAGQSDANRVVYEAMQIVSSADADVIVDVFGSFDLMVSGPLP